MALECAWLKGSALSFDTETTGPDPETARIVTAAANLVGPSGLGNHEYWTVNPGIPIPPEATAIHGVTDEMARAGLETGSAVLRIYAYLRAAWDQGMPVIIMNAPFDLAVLRGDAKRSGVKLGPSGPILDPLVIDRAMDKWRKGKRTLAALALHYGVQQESAHSADGDAICAARIVLAQARRYTKIAKLTLEQMQEFQASHHREWADGFQTHLRKTKPAAVVNGEWPVRAA